MTISSINMPDQKMPLPLRSNDELQQQLAADHRALLYLDEKQKTTVSYLPFGNDSAELDTARCDLCLKLLLPRIRSAVCRRMDVVEKLLREREDCDDDDW